MKDSGYRNQAPRSGPRPTDHSFFSKQDKLKYFLSTAYPFFHGLSEVKEVSNSGDLVSTPQSHPQIIEISEEEDFLEKWVQESPPSQRFPGHKLGKFHRWCHWSTSNVCLLARQLCASYFFAFRVQGTVT